MKKLWGGRFKKKIDKDFFKFQKSIDYDYKLAEYDLYHSLIHVLALKEAGILKQEEVNKLSSALKVLLKQIRDGKFKPNLNSEDIHSDIQDRIEKKLGSLASKLHTLRSRNDQIVFDEKWYCFEKAAEIEKLLSSLLKSIIFLAGKYENQCLIGYTHTQPAQTVFFADYLGAFWSMFNRDHHRLTRFLDNLDNFIGAGSLAGSSLTRKDYQQAIGKLLINKKMKGIKPVENTLDNVSERDFIIEFLSILAIVQMHMSRLAEDFILYSTKEFNFINLPEEFCTGSSLMPHKKNPDFLELLRANTGKIYGNLISVLTTMKGLPLTYNRDMQLDKEPLFSSVKTIKDELKILAEFIKKIELNKNTIKKSLEDKTLYATELAEYLVRKEHVSFKQAHNLVGKLIKYAEKGKGIDEIPDEKLKTFHPTLNKKVINKVMNLKYAVSQKKTVSNKITRNKKLMKK